MEDLSSSKLRAGTPEQYSFSSDTGDTQLQEQNQRVDQQTLKLRFSDAERESWARKLAAAQTIPEQRRHLITLLRLYSYEELTPLIQPIFAPSMKGWTVESIQIGKDVNKISYEVVGDAQRRGFFPKLLDAMVDVPSLESEFGVNIKFKMY
ncbi:hypothetical protein KBC79_04050 [Candidatus Woesebacteria bacterium]|nr:hypothetical protein [Candidatus Woesebacteria bacterium]